MGRVAPRREVREVRLAKVRRSFPVVGDVSSNWAEADRTRARAEGEGHWADFLNVLLAAVYGGSVTAVHRT